ncbi:MAG: hypothetical protein SynsKO_40470 [Synoicihabitans sp.]
MLGALVPSSHAAFEEVAQTAGITYVHSNSSTRIPDEGGACAVDLNQDGWTDLIFARFEDSILVLLNNQDGTFRSATAELGLTSYRDIAVIAAGDLDNDGDPDLILGPTDGPRYFLLMNQGNGSFSEEASSRGADLTVSQNNHHARTISLVDYDRDGYLDIYLPNEGIPTSSEDHLQSALLRNKGSSSPAFFENTTQAAGILQPAVGDNHLGFSSAWADFDGDGWPDFAKVSDFGTSQLYWNNGNGTFTEDTKQGGMGIDDFGMGNAVADVNGDGRLDVFVTSIYDRGSLGEGEEGGLGNGNRLYRYFGNRRFGEGAGIAGIDKAGWAWGASFFEYDNDGDPDLVVTNGWASGLDNDRSNLPLGEAEDDPTTLFINNGTGQFTDGTDDSGINDFALGRAIIVFDYDQDGDEDFVITNNSGSPLLYRSDASTNGNNWLRLKFVGTESNRDGFGADVRVTAGDKTQRLHFNPTNAYLGQRESVLHVGLGAGVSAVESVEITWPSGVVQTVSDLATNTVHTITESTTVALFPPTFVQQPIGGTFAKGETVILTAEATANPAPVYAWAKNGEPLPGETRASLRLDNVHPFDAATYTVSAVNPEGTTTSNSAQVGVTLDPAQQSVARWWNEFLLDAIREDFPDPTVHSRNLFHTSAAMWDAYWAYQPGGWNQASALFQQETPGDISEAAQREAISHAAFTVLSARYAESPGKDRSQFGFRWLMQQLGYDADNTTISGNSPAAVGNRIGAAVLAAGLLDGSNEANNYADTSGYVARNNPLRIDFPGTVMAEPNFWQPLAFDVLITQNGIPLEETTQTFLGVNWRAVTPFALHKPTPISIALDPGPPPQLGTSTEQEFKNQAVEVVEFSALLDPAQSEMIDISPGALLNNPLGTNAGTGRTLNPVTGAPYAPNVVNHADYGRILAEFWADGPDSETPPGHWNSLHNEITDDPEFERRYLGTGAELSPLAWDVQAYVTINGAMHDAAIAAWTLKRQYDLARPVSMIRYLAGKGQSTDPSGPSYDPAGISLVDNLIEVITAETTAVGQRHAHLSDHIGKIAVRAWAGEPGDIHNDVGGVGWILAANWLPYQKSTFVSPAFAAYVSGHSTFSRAGAEVLTLMTGSPFFPGGMGTFHFAAGEFLEFENGPSSDVTLQWATFYDAADQAGISRLYGGIHIEADDLVGRRLGSRVGFDAFRKAHALRYGNQAEPRLVNLSTRAKTGTGAATNIAGFVTRTEGETLLRGVGPTLGNFNVNGFETDPNIALFASGAITPFATNEDWHENAASISEAASRLGAFALGDTSRDSALLSNLAAGAYTFSTNSASETANGVVLAEVYHHDLVNLSTRTAVGSGDEVAIAGFVIESPRAVSVLVRGVGPALAEFGVSGALPDPRITLIRQLPGGGNETVASNNDWQADQQSSLSIGAAATAGAFALAEGSKDAALLRVLEPGAYTVVLESATSETGVALVEVYLVP